MLKWPVPDFESCGLLGSLLIWIKFSLLLADEYREKFDLLF
jgi:hypothetical protein